MKRFFIYFSAFTVLLSVFSVLLPASSVSAASVYDNVIETTDTLTMNQDTFSTSPIASCDAIKNYNWSTRWPELLSISSIDNGIEIEDNTYQVLYSNSGASQATLYGLFNNDKVNWSVSQYDQQQTPTINYQQIRIHFTVQEDTVLEFYDYTPGNLKVLRANPSTTVYTAQVDLYNQGGQCRIRVSGFSSSGNFNFLAYTNPGQDNSKPLFINWPIAYPPDYQGEFPPETGPTLNTVITPSIYYLIDKKWFTFQNSFDLPAIFGSWSIDGLYTQIDWELQRWDEDQGTYNTVVSRRTTVMEKFTFNIDDLDQAYGQFRVQATFFTGGFVPEGFEYGTRQVILPIDGSTYSGDTSQLDCDGLTCDVYEQSPYEDCSTFGLDVVGGIGCVFRNFGVWLVATLQWLFVPGDNFVAGWQRDTGNYLNSKLGFLYSSIGFVTGVFGSILSNAGTGTCTLSTPGTLFGAPVSFNMCSIQQVIGNTAWLAIQGIVISLTILLLAFAAYRKYLEVVDQR